MTKTKSVYIRLLQEDIAAIDLEAKRRGVTRSAIARRAIRAWLRAARRRRAERAAAAIGADMAEVLKQTERISSTIKAKMDEALKRDEVPSDGHRSRP